MNPQPPHQQALGTIQAVLHRPSTTYNGLSEAHAVGMAWETLKKHISEQELEIAALRALAKNTEQWQEREKGLKDLREKREANLSKDVVPSALIHDGMKP